jgi:hypothetical protein
VALRPASSHGVRPSPPTRPKIRSSCAGPNVRGVPKATASLKAKKLSEMPGACFEFRRNFSGKNSRALGRTTGRESSLVWS